MRQETTGALIARLPRFGSRRAVGLRQSFAARWWRYDQLYETVCRAAGRLEAWGIPAQGRIVIWAANSPEWVALLLAALARGCVVAPVDADFTPEQVQRLAGAVQASALFYGAEQDAAALSVPAYSLFEATAGGGPPPPSPLVRPVAPDDPALIMYTSGATSEAKGVVLTHRNLGAQLAAFAPWRRLLRLLPCRMLSLSPLSHVQGLVIGALIPLSIGLSVLYSEAVDPAHVMRTLRQQRITVLLAVPRVQHLLAEALRHLAAPRGGSTLAQYASAIRFFPLRRHVLFMATHARLGYAFYVLMVGGAPLPPEDERFWYECGYVVVQGYGLTETTALASVRINGPFFAKLGSIGKPLAHGEVRLSPDGEILIRGEAVSPGYFDESSAGGGLIRSAHNGFLHTGDVAALDEQQRLYFRGRKKAEIVTGEGFNVHPADVEAALRRQAGVEDAVVAAFERDGLAEIHAVLLLKPDVQAAEAVSAANRELQPYQRIRSWAVWPEADFPRTNLQKIRRYAVVEQLQTLGSHESRSDGLGLREIGQTEDRALRLQALAEYLLYANAPEAGEEELLLVEDLGLSSLDLVELAALVERKAAGAPRPFSAPCGISVGALRSVVQAGMAGFQGPQLPERQPRWSASLPGRLLRRGSQPLLIGLWARFAAEVAVRWEEGSRAGQESCLFVVAPHHHWLDAFAVYAALPRAWRRRLVTVTNRDFSEFFAPTPAVDARTRRDVGLAYYLLWPLLFEFAIVPEYGSTRHGLQELGQFIERGYSPISFPKGLTPPGEPNPQHAPGMATVALESGLPVRPIWLQGNERLRNRLGGLRPRVTVWIGKAITSPPTQSPAQLVAQVERAFGRLATLAEGASP